MSKAAILMAALMGASSLGGCLSLDGSGGIFGDEDPKDPLRLNHVQMKGTHNSYHIEPLVSPTREYMYTHEPLDVQASQRGVSSSKSTSGGIRGDSCMCTTISTTRVLLVLPSRNA